MNPDQTAPTNQEMSIGDAVSTLVAGLPKPVQDFVVSDERARITLQLTQKYNLHVDQAGGFEHAFIFMLLGVNSPEEFVQELRNEGIAEETVQALARDVNEQVFVKLRDAERQGGIAPAPAAVAATAPTVPVYTPPAYVPPTPPIAPVTSAPSQAVPTYTPPTPPVFVQPAPVQTPIPPVPTPAPMSQPPVAVIPPVPTTPVSIPTTVFAPAPATISNTPPIATPPPANNREELHKVMKEYGIDPYREPPDAK